MRNRFTLTYTPAVGSAVVQEIGEPGGVAESHLKLERDEVFHSLKESYEGSFDGGIDYLGEVDGMPGGVDLIRTAENAEGLLANISQLIEFAADDINYDPLFEGLLKISTIKEIDDNTIRCAVIRDDFWSKLKNRWNTPVDITATVDLDGNPVDAIEPVTVNLTPQMVRMRTNSISSTPGFTEQPVTVIVEGTYYQLSFNTVELGELKEFYGLPQVSNDELPAPWFEPEFAGEYTFEFQTCAYDYLDAGGFNYDIGKDISDYIQFYMNVDGTEYPFTVGDLFDSDNIKGGRVFTLTQTVTLSANSKVYVYGKAIDDLTVGVGSWPGQIRWNGPVVFDPLDPDVDVECFARISGDTLYPETQCEGFFIHDIASAICARIGLGNNKFYSDILGSTATKARVYGSDGAFSPFVLLKGVHLRGYTLTDDVDDPVSRYTLGEKPFQLSFKDLWDIIDPIFCLSLMYDTVSLTQVVRIENRAYQFDDSSTSVNFDYVHSITRDYDPDQLYRLLKVGYKQWESENISGIDDPQTKHNYATAFTKDGKELIIESEGIAASLAIETTRRTKREKSADYKFDEKFFIINVDIENPETPESYNPKLDEDFNNVENLLGADTRYNLILTPKRNLYRHLRSILGGLQKFLDKQITFQGGQGNINLITDYDCTGGDQDLGIICDEFAESSHIELQTSGYAGAIGFNHLPFLYNLKIPMPWEDYQAMVAQRRKAIGISQTDTGHTKFFIKTLSYNHLQGEATFVGWPKTFMEIQQISNEPEMACS